MLRIALLVSVACLCEARPTTLQDSRSSFRLRGIDNYILEGQDADPGEWPWMLSQERYTGSAWAHSCGASLLTETKALSAALCVDLTPVWALRVIAGLHNRSDHSAAQISNITSYVVHENYTRQPNLAKDSNDIALLYLETTIIIGGNVGLLTLPPDNSDDFVGATCILTGWGRTSSESELPETLQEADVEALSTSDCASRMSGIFGANIWDNHICFYDAAGYKGACNADTGGPAHCPDHGQDYFVVGVFSWGILSGNDCLPEYPSVYTRTSAYLDWINSN